MFDFTKEEEELEKSKNAYHQITISDEKSDLAICEGIKCANALKRRRKRLLPVKILLSASIFVLAFITSVKISDTFAAFASNIPGLEKAVELIRNDKGLLAAVENDYIQKIDLSDEHDGLKVTVDSVIYDESVLIVFFKYQANDETLDILPNEIKLLNQDNKPLPIKINNGVYWKSDKESLLEARFLLTDENLLPENPIISFEMGLQGKVFEEKWNIPITLDKEKVSPKKVYTLNKVIEIKDQKLAVKKVVSSPTYTAVHIEYDQENSKKIFGIEGLRLEDEKGESWNTTKFRDHRQVENERIFYLESNYFANSKELYLHFDSIRALEKDELWVKIDPETNQILKAPQDRKLLKVEKRTDELAIQIKADRNFIDQQIFMGYAIDREGNEIVHKGPFGVNPVSDGHSIWYTVPFPTNEKIAGPIKLELLDYPAVIEQDVKIKIK